MIDTAVIPPTTVTLIKSVLRVRPRANFTPGFCTTIKPVSSVLPETILLELYADEGSTFREPPLVFCTLTALDILTLGVPTIFTEPVIPPNVIPAVPRRYTPPVTLTLPAKVIPIAVAPDTPKTGMPVGTAVTVIPPGSVVKIPLTVPPTTLT